MLLSLLFIASAALSVHPWYYLMLTIAQLVFVPIALHLIWRKKSVRYFLFSVPAYLSVFFLQILEETNMDWLLAAIYLCFTIAVAGKGLRRFLSRGFSRLEEFSIDMGMIYLAIGGIWFFAHITEIDTGFSPILTWLTAIHFHYSSFLLPIFVGLLGRIAKPKGYRVITTILLIAPLIVALGITFSPWLELLSVLMYVVGIYGLIAICWSTNFTNSWAKAFVMLSFIAIGVTILFSLLYALGTVFGYFGVGIDFMLRFHGFFNCVIFGLGGLIGWWLWTPASREGYSFPISSIRGKWSIGERILEGNKTSELYSGLVDNMSIYIDRKKLAPTISDFYENTNNYRLFASVRWHSWFKPLAAVYHLFSKRVQQLNLPLSQEELEMTGNIVSIVDGREKTRAWVRKIKEEVIFVALYSFHHTSEKTYMNIALPLPWSSMIGVLELRQSKRKLTLTSQATVDSDAGIYLALGKNLFKLPIHERFEVKETSPKHLSALHRMWIFGVPFLTITYRIQGPIQKS